MWSLCDEGGIEKEDHLVFIVPFFWKCDALLFNDKGYKCADINESK